MPTSTDPSLSSDHPKSPRYYYAHTGGLPPQSKQPDDKAIFTTAYALIPKGVMSDIVTSFLPHWQKTRLWVLARPLSGFAETFSHYLVETAPSGGSTAPDDDSGAQSVLFVVAGSLRLTLDGISHDLKAGGYAYIPPRMD